MKDVPAEYLDWLRGQTWFAKWRHVAEYVNRPEIKRAIDFELRKKGIV